jgi:hypothetical protein
MKKMDRDLNMSEMGPDSLPQDVKDHYPTIHFEGPEELGLPEHGTMLVHYKVKREVETKHPPDRHWYSCDIEIRKICGAEAEKDMRPSKRDTSAEDSLDRLMKEREEGGSRE